MHTQNIGQTAELLALDYLQRHGLKKIKQNFTCRFGEIDLIMLDKRCLVFVEVRKRAHAKYGGGIESITISKQRKLIKTAQWFLVFNTKWQQANCRFDALSIDKHNKITWIKNAFEVQYQR